MMDMTAEKSLFMIEARQNNSTAPQQKSAGHSSICKHVRDFKAENE